MAAINIKQMTPDLEDHLHLMMEAVHRCHAQVILELGTARGDSARIWAAALEATKGILYSLDITAPDEVTGGPWVADFKARYPQHVFLCGNSATFPWALPMDILFLDTDHTYATTLAELERFGGWVRPGGVIFCHDTQHHNGELAMGMDVTRAIQEYTWRYNLPWTNHPGRWGMGMIPVPYALTTPQRVL